MKILEDVTYNTISYTVDEIVTISAISLYGAPQLQKENGDQAYATLADRADKWEVVEAVTGGDTTGGSTGDDSTGEGDTGTGGDSTGDDSTGGGDSTGDSTGDDSTNGNTGPGGADVLFWDNAFNTDPGWNPSTSGDANAFSAFQPPATDVLNPDPATGLQSARKFKERYTINAGGYTYTIYTAGGIIKLFTSQTDWITIGTYQGGDSTFTMNTGWDLTLASDPNAVTAVHTQAWEVHSLVYSESSTSSSGDSTGDGSSSGDDSTGDDSSSGDGTTDDSSSGGGGSSTASTSFLSGSQYGDPDDATTYYTEVIYRDDVAGISFGGDDDPGLDDMAGSLDITVKNMAFLNMDMGNVPEGVTQIELWQTYNDTPYSLEDSSDEGTTSFSLMADEFTSDPLYWNGQSVAKSYINTDYTSPPKVTFRLSADGTKTIMAFGVGYSDYDEVTDVATYTLSASEMVAGNY